MGIKIKNRKTNKLLDYLNHSKALAAHRDFEREGRSVTVMVIINRLAKDKYEVAVNEFYSEIDIAELDLREEVMAFTTLEETLEYIQTKEGIIFTDFHAA
jgi:hypothetical protein